jgi:cell division protein FtsL
MLDAVLNGRIWIGLVGVLLAGIVFFNVDLLRMNREITQMADQAAQLKRENARLREDVAGLANSERIQQAAAELGLVLPAPAEVRYLKSNPTIDARTASKRIIAPDPTTTTLPTSTTAALPPG